MGADPDILAAIGDAAARHGVSPDLALAVAHTESGYDPDAVSPRGAMGVMQLMPATARGLGVDPSDPMQNIDGGVKYLAQLSDRYNGDPMLTAAAYNAGPGAVDRHGGVPPYPETQAYVQKVSARMGDSPLPPERDLMKDLQKSGGGDPTPPAPSGPALDDDGTYADPRNPYVHRSADGSVAFLGDRSTTPAQNNGGPLEVNINGTSNPDAIAAYLKAHPEMASAPPVNGSAPNPADNLPPPSQLQADMAKGFTLTPDGAAPAGGFPAAPAPVPTGPPASPGDAPTDVSALTKFSPTLSAGLSSGIDSLTGGFATKGKAAFDALSALPQGVDAFSHLYSANMDGLQAQQAQLRKRAPIASTIGGVGGVLGQALMLPEAPAMGLLGRLGVGALQGGGIGGLDAIGHARGGPVEQAQSAVLPGLLGATGGAAFGGLLGSRLAAAAPAATAEDYARAGVSPIAAVVGGRSAQQAGQMLKGLPIVGAPLAQAADRTAAQLDQGAQRVASSLGSARGAFEGGGALQQGATDAQTVMADQSSRLWAPVNALEANPARLPASNTVKALDGFFEQYPTPAMQEWLARNAPGINQLRTTLQSAKGKLTFGEMKALRTDLGPMARNAEGVDGARIKRLYGALTQDMAAAAHQIGGDEGVRALKAATDHERNMHAVIDQTLTKVLGKPGVPVRREQAFNDLAAQMTGGARADLARVARVKAALPEGAWNETAGAIVHSLGRDAEGHFSAAKFATEWSKLTPEAKKLLLGAESQKDMDALSRVAKQQVAAGKFYNHSQSGSHAVTGLFALEAGGHFLEEMMGGHPKEAVMGAAVNGALGGMGYLGAKLLASPKFGKLLLNLNANASAKPPVIERIFARYAKDNPAIKTELDTFKALVMRRLRSNVPSVAAGHLANARRLPPQLPRGSAFPRLASR